jgi:2-hydroxychromene-2-carboxylate isomerase
VQIEFVLDYRSPYCYLANTQVKGLGAQISYMPVDIVSVMNKVNNQPSTMCPPKARYAGVDAVRWARHYGVPFSPNDGVLEALKKGRVDKTLFSRAGVAAKELGIFEQVSDALLKTICAGTDDLTTSKGRSSFLVSRSIQSDLWEIAASPEIARQLAANDQNAAERGAFGVPTFFVGEEMFFGNDRLPFVKPDWRRRTRERAIEDEAHIDHGSKTGRRYLHRTAFCDGRISCRYDCSGRATAAHS